MGPVLGTLIFFGKIPIGKNPGGGEFDFFINPYRGVVPCGGDFEGDVPGTGDFEIFRKKSRVWGKIPGVGTLIFFVKKSRVWGKNWQYCSEKKTLYSAFSGDLLVG